MSHRNGIYIAFHASGTTDPTDEASDIKCYNLFKAWDQDDDREFSFVAVIASSPATRATGVSFC